MHNLSQLKHNLDRYSLSMPNFRHRLAVILYWNEWRLAIIGLNEKCHFIRIDLKAHLPECGFTVKYALYLKVPNVPERPSVPHNCT